VAQQDEDVIALQQERVRDKLPLLYERDSAFVSSIKKANVEIVSSRFMRIPLQLIPGGVPGGFNPDGGDLGTGSGTKYDVAQVTPNWQLFRVQMNKLPEWSTDTTEKAVRNSFQYELKNAMKQFDAYQDMLMQSNGNGVLGTVSSVSGATATMSTPYGASLVSDNMVVNILNSALTTQRVGPGGYGFSQAFQVIQHDAIVNKQIVFSANLPGTVVSGDVIVEPGVTPGNTTSYFGVPYHMSNATTGTWLNLNRATYPYQLQTGSVNGNNSAITPGMVRLAYNTIELALGADAVKEAGLEAWMNVQQKAQWENAGILISQIIKEGAGGRANDLDLNFNGSYTMGGVPLKTSIHWNQTRVDFISKKHWGRAVTKDMDFYDVKGTTVFPIYGASGGIAASQIFYLVIGQQWFIDNPRAAAYISSLAVPSGY
jgi:hypothetical protein